MVNVVKKFLSCSWLKNKPKTPKTPNINTQRTSRNRFVSRWRRLFRQNSDKVAQDIAATKNTTIPTDCLLEVFEYFQDDLKTLHSCLLVNKNWCVSTVRLIWRHPFLNKSSPKVIDVYLSCLTLQEKNSLSKNSVNLSNCTTSATFYYANFLRHLDMENFHEAVCAWSKRNGVAESNCRRSADLVCRALCRLFITKCEIIQKLCLNWNHIGKWKRYPIFPYHPNESTFLCELSELSIHNVKTRDVFLDISKHAKNIVKLEILDYCFYNLPEHRHRSIHTLIRNQSNLQHFKLFAYGSSPIIPMEALQFQSNSLIHFELIYAKFVDDNSYNAFSILSNCRNLNTLIIEDCYFKNQEYLRPLAESHFPHLRKIRFKNLQSGAAEIFIGLIKNNSSSLKELHYSSDTSRRFSHSFLQAIVTYSTTSLISLTIPFRNGQTPHLVTLLSFSTQLQSLKLIGPYGHQRAFIDFLPVLAGLLPISLRNLSLDLNWAILNTLPQFLLSLKSPLSTLYFSGWSRIIRDNDVSIIKEYLTRNNLQLDLYNFIKDIT